MRLVSTYAGLAIVVVVTVVGGVMHGRLSGRVGNNERMTQAAERVLQLPKQFGDWETRQELELNDRAQELLDLAGYVNRIYSNQLTGEKVEVIVMVGRPGPLSVHTPEVCYSSRDMTILGEPERRAISSQSDTDEANNDASTTSSAEDSHQFWKVAFQEKDLSADRIGVWYAWSDGGPWMAPKQPRFSLSGSPFLYKTQIRSEYLPPRSGEESKEEDPCERFVRDFVPVLDKVVFEPGQQ